MSVSNSQFIPAPFLPFGIHTFVLYICNIYFCFANKMIYTIFLDSTYMCQYFFFSFWLTSLYDISRSVHPRLCKWPSFILFQDCITFDIMETYLNMYIWQEWFISMISSKMYWIVTHCSLAFKNTFSGNNMSFFLLGTT